MINLSDFRKSKEILKIFTKNSLANQHFIQNFSLICENFAQEITTTNFRLSGGG